MARRPRRREYVISILNGKISLYQIFERFLRILDDVNIYKVRALKDPYDEEALSGYCDPMHREIFISPDRHTPALLILIHELCHMAFPRFSEKRVIYLEGFLYDAFTDAHRQSLLAYIPKEYSKHQPRKV